MRKSLLSICTIATLAAGHAAATTVEDLENVVPASSSMVLLAKDAPTLIKGWSTSPFGRLWQDPQVKRFFAPLREELEIDRWDELAKEETGYELEELLEKFEGAAVLFTTDIEEWVEVFENDDSEPEIAFLVGVGENGAELEELLIRQQERDRDESGDDDLSSVTRQFAGVELHIDRRSTDDGPLEQDSWAVFDGLLAVTTTPELLESIITDVRNPDRNEALAASPNFRSVKRQLRANDAVLYVNLEHMMRLVRAGLEEEMASSPTSNSLGATPDAVYDALGLDSFQGLFAGVSMEKGSMGMDVGFTYAGNRGITRALAYGPGEAPRPAFIPADAVAFSAAQFDFQAAWKGLEDMFNAVNPSLLAMAGAQVDTMLQNAGVELDLRRDLLENLEGEIVSVQLPSSGATPDDQPSLLDEDQVIGVKFRERQSFELAIETLKGLASRGSELFSTREFVGTTIYSLDAAQDAGGVSYALTDDYLLLSIGGTTSLEAVLVGMSKRSSSAWDLPEVKRSLVRLPAGATALSYQDLPATGETLFNTLAVLANMESEDFAICDPGAIPDQDVIAKYLSAMVSGVYKDEAGLVMRFLVLPAEGSSE